jgi:hypothetical protein
LKIKHLRDVGKVLRDKGLVRVVKVVITQFLEFVKKLQSYCKATAKDTAKR